MSSTSQRPGFANAMRFSMQRLQAGEDAVLDALATHPAAEAIGQRVALEELRTLLSVGSACFLE